MQLKNTRTLSRYIQFKPLTFGEFRNAQTSYLHLCRLFDGSFWGENTHFTLQHTLTHRLHSSKNKKQKDGHDFTCQDAMLVIVLSNNFPKNIFNGDEPPNFPAYASVQNLQASCIINTANMSVWTLDKTLFCSTVHRSSQLKLHA